MSQESSQDNSQPPYTNVELQVVAELYLEFTAPQFEEGGGLLSRINPQAILLTKLKEQAIGHLPEAMVGIKELSVWPQLQVMSLEAFLAALEKVVELDKGDMVKDGGCSEPAGNG